MLSLINMPHLPTEIWDKIFDIKYTLDIKKHNDYHKPLLEELRSKSDSFDCMGYVNYPEWFFECLSRDSFDINNTEYDPLGITSDESEDDYWSEEDAY